MQISDLPQAMADPNDGNMGHVAAAALTNTVVCEQQADLGQETGISTESELRIPEAGPANNLLLQQARINETADTQAFEPYRSSSKSRPQPRKSTPLQHICMTRRLRRSRTIPLRHGATTVTQLYDAMAPPKHMTLRMRHKRTM